MITQVSAILDDGRYQKTLILRDKIETRLKEIGPFALFFSGFPVLPPVWGRSPVFFHPAVENLMSLREVLPSGFPFP